MSRVLVSGGFFDQTIGLLTIIERTTDGLVVVSDNEIEHPKPEISVVGKGITGIAIDGDYVWACFSNIIAKIRISDFVIVDTIEDKHFNDLHEITLHNNQLYVANTGYESVHHRFGNKENRKNRFTCENIRKNRPNILRTKIQNPICITYLVSQLMMMKNIILGLVRQQRILNLTKWEWIGTKHSSPVHDVDFIDGKIFTPSVV